MNRACLRLLLCAAVLAMALTGRAEAHPHVWVTVVSDIVYAPDGKVTGVRHRWTFDDMFSSFATQGMDTDKDGKLSREELKGLAEVNVTSLKDFDFFTMAKMDGRKATLLDPVDYFLEHADSKLTLHFTLPLKTPAKARAFEMDVYDTTYFVDFTLAEKDPVQLVGAPGSCKVSSTKKGDVAQAKPLSESFFEQLDAGANFGMQFANTISVACP